MTDDLRSGVQSAHSRARIVLALLGLGLLSNVISIFSSMGQFMLLSSVLDGAQITDAQAAANDARQRGINIIQIAVFIATVIFWLLWQYRAYSNLSLVGSRDTEETPGWSVGYWFIPIINIFKPYQITAELWRKSELQNARDPIGGLSGGTPLVLAWWIVYVLNGLAARLFGSLVKSAKSVDELMTATMAGILSDVVGIVACILAILVVQRIDRFQAQFPAGVAAPIQ
jgi:Domain of unknown function (DUF4328)